MNEPPARTFEQQIAHAREMAQWYAAHSPYRLNPDPRVWEGIVRAIGRQAFTRGFPYCP
jgi:ferredoxin-thioredoxin reductase catalytic subunit